MNGALPLPVLESTVRAWMTQQVAAPRP